MVKDVKFILTFEVDRCLQLNSKNENEIICGLHELSVVSNESSCFRELKDFIFV